MKGDVFLHRRHPYDQPAGTIPLPPLQVCNVVSWKDQDLKKRGYIALASPVFPGSRLLSPL